MLQAETMSSRNASRANSFGAVTRTLLFSQPMLGFRLRVDVVIDVQDLAAKGPFLIEQLMDGVKALPRLRGDAQHGTPGNCLVTSAEISSICAGVSSSCD